MPGIYIMALITSLIVLGLFGWITLKKSNDKERTYLVAAMLLGVPAFFVAYYLFRLPLNDLVASTFQSQVWLPRFITTWYAPLTEEIAKLLVALAFLTWAITKKNAWKFALMIGLGFGLGEIWFLAHNFAQSPEVAVMPWYIFTGFLYERFLVVFLHGAFLLVTLYLYFRKKYYGIFYAMLLHWVLNFPIFIGLALGWSENIIWLSILSMWSLIIAFGMLFAVSFMIFGKNKVGFILMGKTTCPECKKVYDRPWLGLNLHKRYERCPHCKKWHWTPLPIGRKKK